MLSSFSRSIVRRGPTLARYASQARPPTSEPKPDPELSSTHSEPVQNPTPAPEEPLSEQSTLNTPPGPLPSLDISPLELGGPHGQQGAEERTGAKSARDNVTSAEKQRRSASRFMTGLFALAFGLQVAYMGREWESSELAEKKMKLEDAPNTRYLRTKERFTDLFNYFNKPAFPELLPPPMPAPHQKPYTLLISLDDLLITSTWDRQNGWRTAKRPGVDYFLGYLSQFYEVVLFTSQNSYTAAPIVESLDRYNFYITYKLFREATRSMNGQIVKDLSYLNRDLSKVIMLDTVPEHVQTHKENSIVIPKWKGDPKDRGLIAMIPFLESIGIYKPPDVRPILEHYQGKNIPIEYAKTEAQAKAKHIEDWKAKHAHHSSSSSFTLSSLFGGSTLPTAPSTSLSSSSSSSTSTTGTGGGGGGERGNIGMKIPPTFLEQKRFEAQMQFKEEQAWITKNKDYLEKLREQDEAAAQAAMPGNIWEALDQMTGKQPPPTPPGTSPEATASTTTTTMTTTVATSNTNTSTKA